MNRFEFFFLLKQLINVIANRNLSCYTVFVLRQARRLCTLLTCTILASFYPINPPAWCYVVVAKIIPGLVGHSENVSLNVNLSPSRRAQRPEISRKPAKTRRDRRLGSFPGSRGAAGFRGEGPRRRLPFQSGGNVIGGNCLKMKIASPGRQLESRKVEILHKLAWPRQSVVSQPWHWRTLAVRVVRREMQPHKMNLTHVTTRFPTECRRKGFSLKSKTLICITFEGASFASCVYLVITNISI